MGGAKWGVLASVLALVALTVAALGAESKVEAQNRLLGGRKLLQFWNQNGQTAGTGFGNQGGTGGLFGSGGGLFGSGGSGGSFWTPSGGSTPGFGGGFGTPSGFGGGGLGTPGSSGGFGNLGGSGTGGFFNPPGSGGGFATAPGSDGGSATSPASGFGDTPPGSGFETPVSGGGLFPAPPPPTSTRLTGRGCFPADATVTLRDGSTKTMGDLTVGDVVATVDASGSIVFEPVYFFGHRVTSDLSRYVRIHVVSPHGSAATVELTPGHFVHSNAPGAPRDFASRVATRAAAVTPGATLWLASSHSVESANVTSVEVVHKSGMFNPYTMGGDIIVDRVLASAHSDWILDSLLPTKWHHHMPAVYQHLFTPLRFIYRLAGPTAVEAVHQQAAIAKKGTLAYALRELVSWPIVQKSEL